MTKTQRAKARERMSRRSDTTRYGESVFLARYYLWCAQKGGSLALIGGDPIRGGSKTATDVNVAEGREAYKAMARFRIERARKLRLSGARY